MSDTTGAQAPPAAFAGWGERLGALIIDLVPTTALFVVFTLVFGESETSSNGFQFELSGLPFVAYLAVSFGWFGYNWLYRQGSTGETIGKSVSDIAVHAAGTTQPIGAGLTLVRQLCHLVDGSPCLLGYLWPLWDKEKRTFADLLMSTHVHRVKSPALR